MVRYCHQPQWWFLYIVVQISQSFVLLFVFFFPTRTKASFNEVAKNFYDTKAQVNDNERDHASFYEREERFKHHLS